MNCCNVNFRTAKLELNIDPPEAEIFVDVALPPGRRSCALWAGGRGVGATTPTSRRLRSVIFMVFFN